MKKFKNLLIMFWLAALPAGFSQRNGVVEGRLVNGTDPSIIARSVELDIVELGAGMNIIKTATSDSSGKFRIEGLPGSGRLMIRAVYKEVNYHSQFTMDASGKVNVDIKVFEPTTSMEGIEVESERMAFQLVGDHLESLETITFNNKTKPPRTLMNPEGNFRFSKSSGITELPNVRVTAPGSSMPLVQAPLESPDGQYYYSLYPMKPGITMFEVQQAIPYPSRNYTFTKKFYQDVASADIGISPMDMTLSGEGLSKISSDANQNFSVYRSAPIKAGTQISWTFSGGTPVPEQAASGTEGEPRIEPMPDTVSRNALIIGPLVLMVLLSVLWYAFNQMQKGPQKAANPRARELKDRREQLLNTIADLDHRFEIDALGRQEFLTQREDNKRRLRRISLLLKM